jgi:hypothetical protein
MPARALYAAASLRSASPVPARMRAGVGPVPARMWAGVGPVPVQMLAGVGPVPAQMWRRRCALSRRSSALLWRCDSATQTKHAHAHTLVGAYARTHARTCARIDPRRYEHARTHARTQIRTEREEGEGGEGGRCSHTHTHPPPARARTQVTYLHNDSFPSSHHLAVGPLGYQGSQVGLPRNPRNQSSNTVRTFRSSKANARIKG